MVIRLIIMYKINGEESSIRLVMNSEANNERSLKMNYYLLLMNE
jgi:hypothetical protein